MAQTLDQEIISNAIAVPESEGNYGAKNPESTARGKYQFVEKTWNGLQKNYPDLPKVNFQDFERDPAKYSTEQELYQKAYLNENNQALEKRGFDVTPGNQYLMHWLGAPKASAVLSAKGDEPLNQFFTEDVLKKNRLAGDTTIADFRKTVDQKMMSALDKKSAKAAASFVPVVGQTLANGGVAPPNQAAPGPVAPRLPGESTDPNYQNTPKLSQEQLAANLIAQRKLGLTSAGQNTRDYVPTATPTDLLVKGTTANEKTIDEHNIKTAESVQTSVDIVKSTNPSKQKLEAADQLKAGVREFGPNWGMAFAAALFGNKEAAFNFITGGQVTTQIGEATVPDPKTGQDRLQQIRINTNARGDKWFTDEMGNRLPDQGLKVKALSPETSIAAILTKASVEASGLPSNLPLPEQVIHTQSLNSVNERSSSLKTEQTALSDISSFNQKFKPYLDESFKNSKNVEGMKSLIESLKIGFDPEKIQDAAKTFGIPQPMWAEFKQYMRRIVDISTLDKNVQSKNAASGGTYSAPGAGLHGEIDFKNGSKGVDTWLADRTYSYGLQKAWNDFYISTRKTNPNITVNEMRKEFEKSDTFRGLENNKNLFIKQKIDPKHPINIKDNDVVMTFNNNGDLVEKRYNAKTGKAQ